MTKKNRDYRKARREHVSMLRNIDKGISIKYDKPINYKYMYVSSLGTNMAALTNVIQYGRI